MRILVAGGAGFIGSWTVEDLLKSGHEIVVFDNLESGSLGNLSAVANDIQIIEEDIRDIDRVLGVKGPIDSIVHLGFPTPLCTRDRRLQFYDTASIGTANLIELALDRDAQFFYGSSISVYGRQEMLPITETSPTTPMLLYGVNKLLGEQLCSSCAEIYGLRYCALRISDTYGPRDKRTNAVNNFLSAAKSSSTINISGSGNQRRSYTYVKDIATVIAKIIVVPCTNEVFNVTSDEATSIAELACLIQKTMCPTLNIINDINAGDTRDYVFSVDKLLAQIGAMEWTPLEEGLRATYSGQS